MDGVFTSTFFWAQVAGLFATGICVGVWQIKNPRKILLFGVPGAFLWGVQYLLLGAPLGALTNFSSAAKDLILVNIHKKYLPILVGVFLLMIWGIGLYMMSTWADILPIFSVTLFNLALLFRDNRSLLARSSILSQILWIMYNIIVGSWMGLLCSSLTIISTLWGMARHEEWEIGKCYKSFMPSLARSLFVVPNFRTYP